MSENLPEIPPDQRDIYIWDTSNARSVVRLVPRFLAEAMVQAVEREPELFNKDERDLYQHFRHQVQWLPTPTDNRLRLNFWLEYDHSQASGNQMRASQIVANICSQEYFHKVYSKSVHKIAWLLCPPVDYVTKAREALAFTLDQLRDIVDMHHVGPTGKIDHKLIEAKIKIFKLLDDRIQGAAVQRVQVQGHVTGNERVAVNSMVMAMQEEELDKQIKELRKRTGEEIIDVTNESSSEGTKA